MLSGKLFDPPKSLQVHYARDMGATRFAGDMPRGWTFLFTYWSRTPRAKFMDIPADDVVRDGVLCPAHVRALESHLKELGRKID